METGKAVGSHTHTRTHVSAAHQGVFCTCTCALRVAGLRGLQVTVFAAVSRPQRRGEQGRCSSLSQTLLVPS